MKEISNIRIYLKSPSNVYHFVDKSYIGRFSGKQQEFMTTIYYNEYTEYCYRHQIKTTSIETFLNNAKNRKVKILQLCCPHCGKFDIWVRTDKYSDLVKTEYCVNCGHKSTARYIFGQLSAFITLNTVHQEGLSSLRKNDNYEDSQLDLILSVTRQIELVELASLLEKSLRDFYQEAVMLKYALPGGKYLSEIINNYTKNDFMQIEKANKHYKKALGIDIKQLITDECWRVLVDLAAKRNVIVHNNGVIDYRYLNSRKHDEKTSLSLGERIWISEDDAKMYLKSVLKLITTIGDQFNTIFEKEIYTMIANHYFRICQ